MQVDLSKLLGSEGASEEFSVALEAEQFSFGKATYALGKESDIRFRAEHDGKRHVKITGKAVFSLVMPCARCAEDVQVPFELPLDVTLDFDHPAEEVLDEQYYVCGYCLDVDLLVFDELSLHVPMSVLCKEDCEGLCPTCGQNLNRGTCTCTNVVLDPRMAKIADIFKNMKEV